MTRYLDITGVLEPGIWSYGAMMPGFVPPFEQKRWATIEANGFENDWFAMPTLYGTYLETAKHLFADAPSIEQVPVEKLFVNASIAVIPKGPLEHITVEDLDANVHGLEAGDALLFTTGWEQ
ncbi:MAG: cyclase family protein, partial [Thermomicrobiales bacterium]